MKKIFKDYHFSKIKQIINRQDLETRTQAYPSYSTGKQIWRQNFVVISFDKSKHKTKILIIQGAQFYVQNSMIFYFVWLYLKILLKCCLLYIDRTKCTYLIYQSLLTERKKNHPHFTFAVLFLKVWINNKISKIKLHSGSVAWLNWTNMTLSNFNILNHMISLRIQKENVLRSRF